MTRIAPCVNSGIPAGSSNNGQYPCDTKISDSLSTNHKLRQSRQADMISTVSGSDYVTSTDSGVYVGKLVYNKNNALRGAILY